MADSTNETPSVPTSTSSSSATTWRKISLPLPHLFPHLTISFRGHLPGRPPSPPTPASGVAHQSALVTKPKSGRDWKLRRQKTYDSPGCLNPTSAKPPHRLSSASQTVPAAVKVNDTTKKFWLEKKISKINK